MPSVSIKLETNYNNKLECPRFLHIDLAPRGSLTESIAESTMIEVGTKDDSHVPVMAKVDDLCRIQLQHIPSALTWASHGMNREEFQDHIKKSIPGIQPDTPMAVYFYKHVEA